MHRFITRRLFSQLAKKEQPLISKDNQRPSGYIKHRAEVDEALNLRTHIFNMESFEKHANSRYLLKKDVRYYINGIKKMITNNILNTMNRREFNASALRRGKSGMPKPYNEEKPDYNRIQHSTVDKQQNYNYLMDNIKYLEQVANFIKKEREYLFDFYKYKEGEVKQNLINILETMEIDYADEKYFCDDWQYFNEDDTLFELKRSRVWNTNSYLNEKADETDTIMDYNTVSNYLLEFRDDFSYFLCRHLKNNTITKHDVKCVRVCEEMGVIGVKLLIEGNELLIIKRLDSDKYLRFYIANEAEDFWIIKKDNKPTLVFKPYGSSDLLYLCLEEDDFMTPAAKDFTIKSVTSYMNANMSKLILNSSREVLEERARMALLNREGYETNVNTVIGKGLIFQQAIGSMCVTYICDNDETRAIFVS